MHAYYVPGTGRGSGDTSVNQTRGQPFRTAQLLIRKQPGPPPASSSSAARGEGQHRDPQSQSQGPNGKGQLSQSLPSRLPCASYWPEVGHLVALAAKESGRSRGAIPGLPQTYLVLSEKTEDGRGDEDNDSFLIVTIITSIPHPGPGRHISLPSPPHTPHRRDSPSPRRSHSGRRSQGSSPGSEPQEPGAPGGVQTGFPGPPLRQPLSRRGRLF